MIDWLRFIALVAGVSCVVWFGIYLFDRHMIDLIKRALEEREQEKPGSEGNSRA